jgi:hypothetical protein
MKQLFAYVWKRRWYRVPLCLAILFGIACLHPFVRQFIFGPTVDGIPWCAWENRIRSDAHADEPRSPVIDFFERIGLFRTDSDALPLHSKAALPIYLHLADDRDPAVRRLALQELSRRMAHDRSAILPTMQRHVTDDDSASRMLAIASVWRATKNVDLHQDLAPLLEDADCHTRHQAIALLAAMAKQVPESFEPLAKATEDADPPIRMTATFAMAEFGARGEAILRARLKDADAGVRREAIIALVKVRKQDAELSADLRELLNDPDPSIREAVAGLPPPLPIYRGSPGPGPKAVQQEPSP